MNSMLELMCEKKVVLFDFDGTVVDSMGMWENVDIAIMKRHGATVPDGFLDMLIPLSEEASAQCFLDHGCHGTVESILNEINELANVEYARRIETKPGAKRLIEYLREQGVKVGLVTAATLSRILPCLDRNGMSGYFHLILTCDDAQRPKSDPEIYRTALRYLKASEHEAVMVDDNLTAIRAAREAGLATVGVYDDRAARRWEDMKQTADVAVLSFEEHMPKA